MSQALHSRLRPCLYSFHSPLIYIPHNLSTESGPVRTGHRPEPCPSSKLKFEGQTGGPPNADSADYVARGRREARPLSGFSLGSPQTRHTNGRALRNNEVVMASSSDNALQRLDVAPSDIPEDQLQGDLVRQGFARLATKCTRNDRRAWAAPGHSFSVGPVDAKKTILTHFKSSLTSLLQQLLVMSFLLELSDLWNQRGPVLKTVLAVQSALEVTLDLIKSMSYTLCTEEVDLTFHQLDDQNDEVAKMFRLSGLDKSLTQNAFKNMRKFFSASSKLILRLGLSTETSNHPDDTSDTQSRLVRYGTRSRDAIECAMRWLDGSELDLVQRSWPDDIDEIDSILDEFRMWTHPSNKIEQGNRSPRPAQQFGRYPPSEPALQLAKSLIPVIKLTRLFFKKSYDWGLNSKRQPLFTKMSSDQLESLASAARSCGADLDEFRSALMYERVPENFPRDMFKADIRSLQSELDTAMLLIVLYFVPDEFPAQDPFKAWLIDWYTSFNLAMYNFEKRTGSVDNDT
ncbi:hypothetical protein MJO28_011713 [Puccinia striiformis f. sp. tritici]|uniref:Uncharacterized protein n=3 Tax=Puccinia striiformis TaxID=27350 RepID=A0A0L0W0F9_9BASI|nr:hypothetical protein Pst134EA_021289 [Puccinia striiformis f. sp. tritici]KNF04993.1 hypothetical protein PSTG_02049 [Puccinia striiformis f. sp. tritici PST-78]POW02441.1 hypothetical protein PSTT_11789 [Puccinia striiformis]KAH9457411.1 hypothetical protein Pst134EA_021289 [Puccinia striiformis f. sp. tritici]KAI7944185.1 hypothetical protein MJO28_011713 [Puccinia striiformis f. sp. tritici]KAI7946947.1 hypothetical protein MJO29_011474 [Puccinia striiformis f. sp. tritici]